MSWKVRVFDGSREAVVSAESLISGTYTYLKEKHLIASMAGSQITLQHIPQTPDTLVIVNGLVYDEDDDYSITGNVITFSRLPSKGKVIIRYYHI